MQQAKENNFPRGEDWQARESRPMPIGGGKVAGWTAYQRLGSLRRMVIRPRSVLM